ncbi:MAG: hypothetical protein M3Q69_02675 [Acidobacteriota bacterium]|nr:hypothetical protein [Acidobacteriota bacterium]
MKLFVISFVTLLAVAPLAGAAENRCTLSPSLLAVYDRSNATLEELGETRRTVSAFLGCDPLHVDSASRRVFFAIVAREFGADVQSQLASWNAKYPDSEALWDGLTIHQTELRNYMDRLFDPARDAAFKDVVLRYGKAKTIARLGRDAKADVTKSLGTPVTSYGLAHRYNAQTEALGALGYWIDAADTTFTAEEKRQFAQILTGLLEVTGKIHGRHQRDMLMTTLASLAHSDDPRALAAVERWSNKLEKDDPIAKATQKTIDAMKARGGKQK